MAVEENKALVAHLVELWNRRDLDGMAAIISPDYVHHTSHGIDLSFAGFRQGFAWLSAAFPDTHHTIQHVVAEGEMVAIYCRTTGSQRGPFFDRAPTGKEITSWWVYHCRIVAGTIVEDWDVMNFRAMLAALGPA